MIMPGTLAGAAGAGAAAGTGPSAAPALTPTVDLAAVRARTLALVSVPI